LLHLLAQQLETLLQLAVAAVAEQLLAMERLLRLHQVVLAAAEVPILHRAMVFLGPLEYLDKVMLVEQPLIQL
jgi:hypothetical protein